MNQLQLIDSPPMNHELQRSNSQSTEKGSDVKLLEQTCNLDTTSFDLDFNDHYHEFMQNLSPCSSNCTKVTTNEEWTSCNQEELHGVKDNINVNNLISKKMEIKPSHSIESSIAPSQSTQSIQSNKQLTNSEFINSSELVIELLNASTHKKTKLHLNDLCEFIEFELYEELQDSSITRSQILNDLTINHLLIYIYHRNQISNECDKSIYDYVNEDDDHIFNQNGGQFKMQSIGEICLFHLGRSYTADRGISDPRYMTSQHFLRDLHLERSNCFQIIFTEAPSYIIHSPLKYMLVKSSPWKSQIFSKIIPVTYNEVWKKKIKTIKSIVGKFNKSDLNLKISPSSTSTKKPTFYKSSDSTGKNELNTEKNKTSKFKRICSEFLSSKATEINIL